MIWGSKYLLPHFYIIFNILQGNRAPVPAPQVFGSRDKDLPETLKGWKDEALKNLPTRKNPASY